MFRVRVKAGALLPWVGTAVAAFGVLKSGPTAHAPSSRAVQTIFKRAIRVVGFMVLSHIQFKRLRNSQAASGMDSAAMQASGRKLWLMSASDAPSR